MVVDWRVVWGFAVDERLTHISTAPPWEEIHDTAGGRLPHFGWRTNLLGRTVRNQWEAPSSVFGLSAKRISL